MKDYYLVSKELVVSNKLSHLDLRVYNYLCANYNVTKHKPFIRVVDIAGTFFYTTQEIIKVLEKFTQIEIDNKKLLLIYRENNKLEFEMPYYKHFLQDLGFKIHNYKSGFDNVKSKLETINAIKDTKEYLFPKLDQFDLSDALQDMPDEDFEKIKVDQIRYPWVYHDEKTRRTNIK